MRHLSDGSMTVVRRFLAASALVRLIRKDRGATRISEGYLAAQPDRISYVRVEESASHLILISRPQGGEPAVEFTEVPRTQAEVLLDVAAGKVVYDRLPLGSGDGREAYVDQFSSPGGVALIRVEFDEQANADSFRPPLWFGPEVTGDGAYDTRALAMEGAPPPEEVTISNTGLNALLDLLDNRFGRSLFGAPAFGRGFEPRSAAPTPRPGPGPAVVAPASPVTAQAEEESADDRIEDVFAELTRTLAGPPTDQEPANAGEGGGFGDGNRRAAEG